MDKGWIKLHRQIQDNMLWTDSESFDRRSAWIDLIMMANVQDKEIMYQGRMLKIKRGQVYTSVRKLAARWHWSRDKVNRFIKTLVKAHMIEKDNRTHSATLLTLVKYSDFQSRADSNKSTHKDSDKSTDKSTDKSLLKNIKNEKEIKESAPPTSSEPAALEEDEEPPVPGAVKMANGGWNYTPDIDWDEVE